MGSFTSTHNITYTDGINPNTAAFDVTITDGDADTAFETGDTYFEPGLGFTYTFQGTAVVDGETWPVFSYVGYPNIFSIFVPAEVTDMLTLDGGGSSGIPIALFANGTRNNTVCANENTLLVIQYTNTPDGKLAVSGTIATPSARSPHFVISRCDDFTAGFCGANSTAARNVSEEMIGNANVGSAIERS